MALLLKMNPSLSRPRVVTNVVEDIPLVAALAPVYRCAGIPVHRCTGIPVKQTLEGPFLVRSKPIFATKLH